MVVFVDYTLDEHAIEIKKKTGTPQRYEHRHRKKSTGSGGSIYCTIMVEKRLALWYNGEKGGMLRGVGNL
jgi:hypothetical protein